MSGEPVEHYLTALGIPFARHEHPPVATVAEAEQYWGAIDALHAKNLFLRDQKGRRHFLAVLAFTRRAAHTPGTSLPGFIRFAGSSARLI